MPGEDGWRRLQRELVRMEREQSELQRRTGQIERMIDDMDAAGEFGPEELDAVREELRKLKNARDGLQKRVDLTREYNTKIANLFEEYLQKIGRIKIEGLSESRSGRGRPENGHKKY